MPWTAVASAVAGSVVSSALSDSGGGGGSAGAMAAADPFASQRGQYQEQLSAMMKPGGFNPQDPSYQWRFDQGQQALERSIGAQGMLGSGNRLMALQQYGQGAASQEYQNQFSRLSTLAGAGTGSPGMAGQIASNQATSEQQGYTALGSAVGNAAISSWNNYQNQPSTDQTYWA